MNHNVNAHLLGLLARMTQEEKIGQLCQAMPSLFGAFGETMEQLIEQLVEGKLSPEDFSRLPRNFREDAIRAGHIGSMGGITTAAQANALQRVAVEESRLGIPLLFGFDVVHGLRTIFPIPLAEACSWEPELARRTAEAAAREAAAAGLTWTFAPMVDIGRDPRWGRVAEGAGEDPFLGSVFAAARVRGFQGDSEVLDEHHVLACAKHFAAYGAAEAGRDYNTADLSPQRLHDVYLPPFHAAVQAGVATVMAGFNDLNGVPCTTNPGLLTGLLRQQWGFTGVVISDANAVAECVVHGHAVDLADASRQALAAGTDVDMSDGTFQNHLGSPDPALLDQAVLRVLRLKERAGLFDRPYRTDPGRETATLLRADHRALAREAARRSLVLLVNDGVLPLSRTARVAVIGALADAPDQVMGTWAGLGQPDEAVTVVAGVKAAVSPAPVVDESEAEVVVAVVGERADQSGEAASRLDPGLSAEDIALVTRLHAGGKAVVALVVSGRPLVLTPIVDHVAALVQVWQLGTEAGHGIADVLFGAEAPSGRLAASFPRHVGQLPLYYAHVNTGRPAAKTKFSSKYLDGPPDPLFPFGFGLTYTTFAYSDLTVAVTRPGLEGQVAVGATVTNTGGRPGEEVVQLYVRDRVASRVRPVRELKGFAKVALAPGEGRRVEFVLNVADLGFHDGDLRFVVEPGEFDVWVAPDAQSGLCGRFAVTP